MVGKKISLGPNAFFAHDVSYWQLAGPLRFGQSLAGQASFHPEFAIAPGRAAAGIAAALTFFVIAFFLWQLLVIGLLILVTKNLLSEAGKYLIAFPWWSLLWGFLYITLTPVAAVFLMATVIGLPLGLILLLLYGLSYLFLVPLAAVMGAHWLKLTYKKRWRKWGLFGVSILVLVGLELLVVVPFIGWLLKAVLVLACVGAHMAVKLQRYRRIL